MWTYDPVVTLLIFLIPASIIAISAIRILAALWLIREIDQLQTD